MTEHTTILEKESLRALMGLGALSSSSPFKSRRKIEDVPRTQQHSLALNTWSPKYHVNLHYVTKVPTQSVSLLLGKESNLSSEQHLGFFLALSGFQN